MRVVIFRSYVRLIEGLSWQQQSLPSKFHPKLVFPFHQKMRYSHEILGAWHVSKNHPCPVKKWNILLGNHHIQKKRLKSPDWKFIPCISTHQIPTTGAWSTRPSPVTVGQSCGRHSVADSVGPIGPVFLAQKMRAIVVSAECFAGTGDSNPQN